MLRNGRNSREIVVPFHDDHEIVEIPKKRCYSCTIVLPLNFVAAVVVPVPKRPFQPCRDCFCEP